MKIRKQFVLAITGPAGSGKSTVASLLAKKIDKCVNIDADYVKHMVSNPFIYDDSTEGIKQWKLLGDNVGVLANNFVKAGYNVLINGYINEPAWHKILEHVQLSHKVLLLPKIEEVIKRDSLRQKDDVMGEKAVRKHHDYFSNSHFFDGFIKLDTSAQTDQETVDFIRNNVLRKS